VVDNAVHCLKIRDKRDDLHAPPAEAAGARAVRASLAFVDLESPALEVLAVKRLIGESGDRMRRPPYL
jgi:hypothetical protein